MSNVENGTAVGDEDKIERSMVLSGRVPTVQRRTRTMTDDDQSLTRTV